ncbi:hypothetical protein PAXRUDRAFT_299359 [Paxillus rubicundulus Ve08.2h10]|uniref:Unplaced genomic scaffold scaffold_1585, whole genome shotgun sequence n=1 Tax=Paxillus rubicundulus Ve08.2h10 TaxID=930991 RepID=A0A0D0CU99_9AGAM|nr:hypothetical protein PAXRUDRAFT_299359 [Paxillus rubicundulus Ve08.2h10]
MTQAKIRLELAKDEAKELQDGNNVSLHAEISPSIRISSAFDLEDQQRRIASDISSLGSNATDQQRGKLQQCVNILQCKLEQWSTIQLLYMPLVACQRAAQAESAEETKELHPQNFKLWLPFQLPQLSGPVF